MLTVFTAIKAIALFSYLALALLTLRSAAKRRVRVFFSIYLFGMLFWQSGSLAVNFAQEAREALLLYNLMIASSATYTILFFPFTRALLDIKKQGFLTVVAYGLCFAQFLSAVLGLQLSEVKLGRAGYWVPVYSSSIMYALSLLSFVFWGFGFFNLVRGFFREKSPVQRNRIVYIMIGAAVTIVGASTNLTPLRDYPVDISANLASAAIIGYAVVRHRLMDIRFILARSLFYSALTASLIAAYLGLILGLEGLLKHSVGYSSSTYGVFAILVLAILFLPLRNLLQAALDKIFFREKGDYQRATQVFSRSVASLYDAEPVLDLVGETVLKQVKPTFVSIYLYNPQREIFSVRRSFGKEIPLDASADQEAQSPLFKWLRKEGKSLVREESLLDPETRPLVDEGVSIFKSGLVSLVTPILLNERLLGVLVIGQKMAGTMYNKEDLSFLATIANQTATALDKSQIFLGIRRRLSEQTLLFILSEKFRSSADFESAMNSIVLVLKNFLSCDHCALVYFDRAKSAKTYAHDRISEIAAAAAVSLRPILEEIGIASASRQHLGVKLRESLATKADLDDQDRETVGSLAYLPLANGELALGILIISDRTEGSPYDEQEEELLRTIRAILSQGIVLYRTIVNLSSVESYNERILNSLNDMGDTLLIIDSDGLIKRANVAACKLLDFAEKDLIGYPITTIIDEDGEQPSKSSLIELLRDGPVSNREILYRSRTGTQIPMLLSGSMLPGESGASQELIVIARDMTERRKAEEASKNLLLVQEIHHRIKNNLQVISSLLFLQAGYVQEERVREMFKDSQNRVRSMALIHEKLYRSQTPSSIFFSDYVTDLVRNLFASYSLRTSKIDLKIDISDIALGMDTAVPCGLIINELVSNALKHAFPGNESGHIVIMMSKVEASELGAGEGEASPMYRLTVTDDGVGFPEGLDLKALKSLGLKIVTTLTHQLHGEVEMRRDGGTQFIITFREAASPTKRPARD